MAVFSLKVISGNGITKFVDSGEDRAGLVVTTEYQECDRIVLETSEKNIHVWLQLDDALGEAFVYLTGNVEYLIPFGEKRINLSPKVFMGSRHYLCVRSAREDEVYQYRNLALNPADRHGDVNAYPHASANVETRGESVFAAKNAIDGVCENRSHGEWPYQSWGINRQDDAVMRIDFGRTVEADKIVLYTRADFPHDNWWKQVTLTFSDGSHIDWKLEKSRFAHVLEIEKRQITWVEIGKLIKADDPSPFPALSQMEVYGRVIKEQGTADLQ